MGTYQKPKKNLHREFLYLNHDAILNSLSAFEAGQVDQIVEKTNEASEGGLSAGIGVSGAKLAGNKKKQATIQEELIRTRTHFSAFDAWSTRLEESGAIGTFDQWDMEVRDAIEVGETVQFVADLRVSPMYALTAAYMSFVRNPATFGIKGPDLAQHKTMAKMMEGWITDRDGMVSTAVYFEADGVKAPRIVGRLSGRYVIGGLENVEERYMVIAQIRDILGPSDEVSLLKVLKDAPPVRKEVETVTEAMRGLRPAAEGLGVDFNDEDMVFAYPDVLVQPLAIFK